MKKRQRTTTKGRLHSKDKDNATVKQYFFSLKTFSSGFKKKCINLRNGNFFRKTDSLVCSSICCKLVFFMIGSTLLFLLSPYNTAHEADTGWNEYISLHELDFFPVVTANIPSIRGLQAWFYSWPQGTKVYEIDTLKNTITAYDTNDKQRAKARTFLRDLNPPDQGIFPTKWITLERPRSARLRQIQQTRDFMRILQHFYMTHCGGFWFFLYI